MFMTTKTITVTKESYDILKSVKLEDESFSELVKRVFKPKFDVMSFAGIMSDMPEKEAEEIKESIRRMREHSSSLLRKRLQ